MSRESVFELHDHIESECDLESERPRIASVVLSAVESERCRLEPVSIEWCFDVAKDYWAGRATEAELSNARVAAWMSIKGRNTQFNDPEVNLVRLLLCALHGRDYDEVSQDGALWIVLDFACSAEVGSKVLVAAMKEHFSRELRGNAR